MTEPGADGSGGSGRVVGWLMRLRGATVSASPWVVVVAAAVLVLASAVSWFALDLTLADLRWPPLLATAALVPFSVALTALEYRIIASVNGVEVPTRDAVVVTVVGSVANLLPLPGAAAVRVGDLTARQDRAGSAFRTTIAAGVLWLGWALVLAGTAVAITSPGWAGWLLLGSGVLAVVGSTLLAPRGRRRRWAVAGSAVEVAALGVGAVRIMLTLAAIGQPAGFVAALTLVASGAISSSVGIVPGGLGIRELIAGLLGPLVGVSAAAAILAVAVNRVVGLALQAPVAASLARNRP